MDIYRKPIDDITFSDVQDFCNQRNAENVRLEYKKEIAAKDEGRLQIAKSVSALANTQGGIVLFGVDAPANPGVPRPPFNFHVTGQNAKSKVNNVCFNSLWPPVISEVKELEDPASSGKGILLVRVSESDATPHCLAGKTTFYVRVNDQSQPVEGSPEQYEWLRNGREKAVLLREKAFEDFGTRLNDILRNHPAAGYAKPDRREAFHVDAGRARIWAACMPTFPSLTQPLATAESLVEIAVKSSPYLNFRSHNWPFEDRRGLRASPGGICSQTRVIHGNSGMAEVRVDGLTATTIACMTRESFESEFNDQPQEGPAIRYDLLALDAYAFLLFGSMLYQNLGYGGLLDFHLEVQGIRSLPLVFDRGHGFQEVSRQEIYDSFRIRRRFTAQQLQASSNEGGQRSWLSPDGAVLAQDILRELLWNFGYRAVIAQKDVGLNALFVAKLCSEGSDECPECKRDKPLSEAQCASCTTQAKKQ